MRTRSTFASTSSTGREEDLVRAPSELEARECRPTGAGTQHLQNLAVELERARIRKIKVLLAFKLAS